MLLRSGSCGVAWPTPQDLAEGPYDLGMPGLIDARSACRCDRDGDEVAPRIEDLDRSRSGRTTGQ